MISESKALSSSLEAKKGKNGSDDTKRHTICIELKLFEPTSDSYPEFNVPKLVYKEMKRRNLLQDDDDSHSSSGEGGGGGEPFNHDSDNDEDVQRIAKKMNEKYGTGTEYDDIGVGYDESDSFIDNTEAYDEQIQDDTPRGGFYINSGRLVFKEKEKKVASATKTGKRQSADTGDESVSTVKRAKSNGNGNSGAEQKPSTKPKKAKKKDSDHEKEKKVVKTIPIKDMIRAQRDNALKKNGGSGSGSGASTGSTTRRIISDEEESENGSVNLSESSQDSDVKIIDEPAGPSTIPTPSATVPFPTGLPENIVAFIIEFKSLAGGKSEEVINSNQRLLEILTRIGECPSITAEIQNQIHSHLTSVFPCKALVRRVSTSARDKPQIVDQNKTQVVSMYDCMPVLE